MITGASSGIGAAFARRLAAEGYDLLLIARRADRLAELAAELRAVPSSRSPPTSRTTRTFAALRTPSRAGRTCSYWSTTRDSGSRGRFFEAPVDEHERMHKLHVIATMRLSHAALKRMAVADSGAVINVSSVAGFTVSPGGVSYSATKNWMNVFTEGLWLDLKSRRSHVKVQALCPGFTYSEFHDVLKMDRTLIPKSMWTPAEVVVDTALRGLESDTLFVIPGWRYKLLVAVLKLAPRALVRAGSLRMARKLKRTA